MAGERILLIEDEAPIRRFLTIALEGAGFTVLEADRGRRGLELAAAQSPQVVLDLGLPDMDGQEVLQRLRDWSRVPVIILSVRDDEAGKVAALDAGANDYVTKPFATGELLARIRAMLRDRTEDGLSPAVIEVGQLRIDLAEHEVSLAGVPVRLTRKEFDVLALLTRHAGRLVTQRQLLQDVWGPAHLADTHYLRIAIGHIRDKLGDDASNPRFIVTEPGIGYRWVDR